MRWLKKSGKWLWICILECKQKNKFNFIEIYCKTKNHLIKSFISDTNLLINSSSELNIFTFFYASSSLNSLMPNPIYSKNFDSIHSSSFNLVIYFFYAFNLIIKQLLNFY